MSNDYRYNEFNKWQNDIDESSIRNRNRFRYYIPNKRPESPIERLDPNMIRRYMAEAVVPSNVQLPSVIPSLAIPQPQSTGAPSPQLLKDNVQWKEAPSQAPRTQMPQMQSQSTVCRLRPGVEFYQVLAVNNSPILLSRQAGSIPSNWNIDFEIRRRVKTYVVGLNEQRVDMMRIQQNPHLLKDMIEVGNPMIGIFLIPESALVMQNGRGNQNMLIDSRYTNQQPTTIRQQQMLNNVIDPARRKLFLG
jgi:hypothetical protein